MNTTSVSNLSKITKQNKMKIFPEASSSTFDDPYYHSLYEVSVAQKERKHLDVFIRDYPGEDTPSLRSIAKDINDRLNRRYSREEKQMIAGTIVDWLQEHERLLKDVSNPDAPVPYLILDDGRAVSLNTISQEIKLAIADAGINMTEKVFSWTLAELQHRCMREGKSVRLSQFTEFHKGNLYISSGTNRLVIVNKIGNDISFLSAPNGSDGVWFRSECCFPAWIPTRQFKNLDDLYAFQPTLESPPETKSYTPEIQMGLLESWILSVLMQKRPLPILVNLGQYSSGKSLLAKAIIKLFMGENGDMATIPCTQRDYVTCATQSFIYGIDNLDGSPEKWLPDLLAQTSTGGMVKERMLYTNGEVYEKPLRSALVITTRTAGFASRSDILDRTLPLFFGTRRDFSLSEKQLLDEVIQNRDALLTGLTIKMLDAKSWRIKETVPDNRFTDFGRVVHALYPDDAAAMLGALYRAKRVSINDDDTLLQAFFRYEGNQLQGNATQIVKELDPDGSRIQYMGGGQKIARALREVMPTLRLNGWNVETAKGQGTTLFRFTRPSNDCPAGSTSR